MKPNIQKSFDDATHCFAVSINYTPIRKEISPMSIITPHLKAESFDSQQRGLRKQGLRRDLVDHEGTDDDSQEGRNGLKYRKCCAMAQKK